MPNTDCVPFEKYVDLKEQLEEMVNLLKQGNSDMVIKLLENILKEINFKRPILPFNTHIKVKKTGKKAKVLTDEGDRILIQYYDNSMVVVTFDEIEILN